jgi:hypothetical protein
MPQGVALLDRVKLRILSDGCRRGEEKRRGEQYGCKDLGEGF